MTRISSSQLKKIMLQLLEAVEVPAQDAEIIAQSLLEADLRGVSSHGILRLPLYLRRVVAGALNPKPRRRILRETLATALIDGDNGFGQLAGYQAMHLAMEKASQCGIGAVAVQRSSHIGAGAYYVNLAGEKDMIGFVVTNTPPLMNAWGGKRLLIGNNPYAVFVPAGEEKPIVFDMAFSQVAQGKISVALAKGENIPLNWATDRDGIPTSDPQAALDGCLLPAGGYKGYGQALIADLLAGVLPGAAFGCHVMSMAGLPFKPQNSGQLYMAINISAFRELEEFKKDVDQYIREIKAAPRVEEDQEVFLPGEQSWRRYEQNLAAGIDIPEGVRSDVKAVAELLNVKIEI
jgi:LDH2 family malate/lactate/ureidoglycolate dehydrogenase